MRKAAALLIAALACGAAAEDARAILDRMDDAMNFDEGAMTLSFEDRKADGSGRTLRAKVLYSLRDGTLVEFVSPEREKGKKVLMLGDSMWMWTPSLTKPVRLSGKDSFMGTSFTNDDIMNFDKSDDYDPRIAAEGAAGWTLELAAKARKAPYQRLVVSLGPDYLPVEMRMFALSGMEAKRIEFSDVRPFAGKPRPGTMTVIDAMTGGNRTVVRFEDIKPGKVDRARLSPTGFMK